MDLFHTLSQRMLGSLFGQLAGSSRQDEPPMVVEQGEYDTLRLWRGETVVEVIRPEQVVLTRWDSTRYCSLSRRVRTNWELYNAGWEMLPTTGGMERAREEVRLRQVHEELCTDLWELVAMCEHTVGTKLPERGALQDVCVPTPY